MGKSDLIKERLRRLLGELPEEVKLVAVSKFKPIEELKAAYDVGQRIFGESRVQELCDKIPQMPSDVRWHFIGHLQTNKVKALVGNIALIESVDSERLLCLIDENGRKKNCHTDVLLQVHVAKEETKFGFSPDEIADYFSNFRFRTLSNTRIRGLMAMASNTDDKNRIREDFAKVSRLFKNISDTYGKEVGEFDTLSMGMSGDWPIAVEEGANLVRVGSAIFGER